MTRTITLAAVAGLAGAANAEILINEVQGSTSGADWEFVELYNAGDTEVDLGGWQVELWDSDVGDDGFGGADGGAYAIPVGSVIPAGGYYTVANMLAQDGYAFTADQKFADNSIENSSYTIILADAAMDIADSILVIDSEDDAGGANRAGEAIDPGAVFGPDGDFLPSGFYRVGDGNSELAILDFFVPSGNATPGAMNVPAPAAGIALLGLGAAGLRRRR